MTIAGQQSVAELRDLVAAKDFEMAAMAKSYGDYSPAWVTKDSATFVDWTNDWANLQKRYNSAHGMAQSTLDNAHLIPLLSEAEMAAQAPWDAIIRSLKQDPNTISKGDLQDLYQRLVSAGATAPNLEGMPQPKAGTDVDLNLLNALPGSASAKSCDGFCIPGLGGDCLLCIPRWMPIAAGAALILVYFGPGIAAIVIPLFVASRK